MKLLCALTNLRWFLLGMLLYFMGALVYHALTGRLP